VFTPTALGQWTMRYTFTDAAGVVADPGLVNVNVVPSENITIAKAIYTAPKVAGTLGTIVVDGTSSIGLGQIVELRLPNAATGAAGCNNPSAGTRVAVSTVSNAGAWAFGATALQAAPATAYVYSPAYGGCSQVVVTLK
jgi:hypothetical protein